MKRIISIEIFISSMSKTNTKNIYFIIKKNINIKQIMIIDKLFEEIEKKKIKFQGRMNVVI